MPHRLFISVKISLEARAELTRLQEKLKRENQRLRITWVQSEVLHLTLYFLGDCESEEIKEIEEIMRNLVREKTDTPFLLPRLTLNSLDAFPNSHEPRVIVVKAKDEGGRLSELQKRLGQELSRKGFEIDPRLFKTHITLGRVKSQGGRVKGLDLPVTPVSWLVEKVELMESRLTPEGPIYQEILTIEF